MSSVGEYQKFINSAQMLICNFIDHFVNNNIPYRYTCLHGGRITQENNIYSGHLPTIAT